MTDAKASGPIFNHEESVLVLIDYQPEMFGNVRSETSPSLIDLNVRLLARAAMASPCPPPPR